ncbi:MAG TPA: glycosyltransferase family 9 protein [Chthoniobacterales bacterium]|jgi:ADP-heptose:LPS heptosyltransferase
MTDITPLRRTDHGLGGAIRWKINNWLTRHPKVLHWFGARLTVFDVFGAPGDTLLTGIVCRHLHKHFPRIRLNCLTRNPELLRLDPNIDTLNEPESFLCLWHSYLDLLERNDAETNVLRPTLAHLGIRSYEYRGQVFLSDEERAAARKRLGEAKKPIITFNMASKEPVKIWPVVYWIELLGRLRGGFTLVQLGDKTEPEIDGVCRFAGILSMRESMAVLSFAQIHIGPDSFLMHAANGVNVPSVAIFGGARTPGRAGYNENINLFMEMSCGPCWIHVDRGEQCGYDVECMKRISVDSVYDATMRLWARRSGYA